MEYVYDFGDYVQHVLTLEGIAEAAAEHKYPKGGCAKQAETQLLRRVRQDRAEDGGSLGLRRLF
jgi:hypothetical protein